MKYFKWFFIAMISGTLLMTLVAAVGYWYFARALPTIISVKDYRPSVVTRVYGSGGKRDALMGEFFRERRYVVPYDQIPKTVIEAFISAEDDKFFEHQGVNLASIVRAMIANFKAGHVVQGGSTITQQVAKSLLLTSERSFVRKARELILSSRIESNLTKQEILFLYLNQIYLGQGAYGVEAAAKTYFGKSVGALALAEAALIAGLPQAPSLYSPLKNPKKAKERQTYVLRRMLENKFITQTEHDDAMRKPLRIYDVQDVNLKHAPYMIESVRKYLVEKYGDNKVLEEGLEVNIAPSPELVTQAQNALKTGLRAVDRRQGYRGPLKHLKTSGEIEGAMKEMRYELIRRELGYSMFVGEEGKVDAQMNTIAAVADAGFTSEAQLLKENEVYEAVITSFDEKKKSVHGFLGVTKIEIPYEEWRWAISSERPRPLQKGDVVVVRIVKAQPDGLPYLASLDQYPQVQGALYSMDARTGAILAFTGGYDFTQSEFNRALQAERQPGSAFKPVIYSAALERGYNPVSIIVDSPIVYDDVETGKWKPANFEEKFYGDTTLRQALIKSRNVPTIKLVQSITVPYLIEFAKRLGFTSALAPDLSISLGSGTITLAELTKAYAIYPRLGKKVNPVLILSIKDRDGNILEESKLDSFRPESALAPVAAASPTPDFEEGKQAVFAPSGQNPEQVLDPRVAYIMTHLMNEVVAYGTGHEAKALGRVAAGKTGTTNDYLDAWFMGFTPQIVTGVWVGYDSQKPIGKGETGAKAALPIWLQFMQEAVKGFSDEEFMIPEGIVFASIDPNNGKLAPPNSSRAIREAFIEGTEPRFAPKSTENQSEFLKEDIE